MNKALEALDELIKRYEIFSHYKIPTIKSWDCYLYLETELKRTSDYDFLGEHYRECLKENEKLKALEIIKEKKVQVGLLIHILNDENVIERSKTYQGNYFLYLYNSCCGELYGRLTQEEFDLLKEVLKYE